MKRSETAGPSVTSTVPVSAPLGGAQPVSADQTTDSVAPRAGDGTTANPFAAEAGQSSHSATSGTTPRNGLHG